ncbi:uncharacterized protein LOC107606680 [Arachis ipaensis]|uniref:uncharacterized protein LOC107606680 n=1 Tax=Arachis ipaensis TaxID=130454 RepID=UPI0007AF4736|nr:uncharacterized protein LOC107606680 [Arachis ipaensis]
MASNSPYIVILVYPNYRMRNGDNGVTFECEDPILFRTQRAETLSDLRSLISSKLGGSETRKIGRVAYRLLAPMGNGVFRFQLFRLLGDEHVRVMFDVYGRIMVEQVMDLSAEVGHYDRPLAPPPIHVAVPVDEAEEGEEESDENYMVDSGDSDLSASGDQDECVPETPVPTVARHVLPPPHPIPALSAVPSHYHSLDLDAMHERTPFLDTGEEDYNLDGGVEFRVGHKFRSREAVLQGVKNYSIHRSAEYRVIESDRLKYHVQCRQAENGCQWSLRVALRQNLGYWEVRRVGGVHTCLAPTMSQDHRAVQASYHFKPSYRKVWTAKQKAIAQIYGHWEELYNEVPKLLQALQSYFSGTIFVLRVKPFYDGHLLVCDYSMFDKVFWSFPSCVKAFKNCKPFVSVDGMHLYGRYGGVLLIAVAQDGNNNILPIAFAIVESESTESWSFFLTNLRHHVTPQNGLLVISDRSQAIKAALSADDSGWHPPRAYHAYYIRHMAANFMTRFKSAEDKRYLINAAYSPNRAGYEWYMDVLRGVSPAMVD